MSTVRLHLTDSLLLAFDAHVAAATTFNGKPALVLDRTAFYAEAGGQRADRGTLDIDGRTVAITDVQIDESGVVHHVIEAAIEGAEGRPVRGAIDEAHRRDQMSQHTGQHMLSRAFFDVARLETVSARLGNETSTIDLNAPAVSRDAISAAEEQVNRAVLEDRPVRILYPTQAELAAMKLRKTPTVDEGIRIIDVEGFDLTPCGGTHCERTGQVGPVVVTGQEKYKGATRITFLAGQRAIAYWQRQDALVRDGAAVLATSPAEMLGSITRLKDELRSKSQALGAARAELGRAWAQQTLAASPPGPSGTTWIFAEREHEDLESLRGLAAALCTRADVIAVLSSVAGDDRLVVAHRGTSVSFNLGVWFKSVAVALGGRGGGRPEHVEGKVPANAGWDEAARAASAG